jgi:hypothetical protein
MSDFIERVASSLLHHAHQLFPFLLHQNLDLVVLHFTHHNITVECWIVVPHNVVPVQIEIDILNLDYRLELVIIEILLTVAATLHS